MATEGQRDLRAAVVGGGAAVSAGVLLHYCPPGSSHVAPGDPTSAVVVTACWVGWLLATYLLVATAVAAAGHLPGAAGRVARVGRRATPVTVRALVDAAVGAAVVTSVVAGSATAFAALAAAPPAPAPARTAAPLEWPGLRVDAVRVDAAGPRGGPTAPARLVVHPGDSLWRLAATLLGRHASAARVAETWPALYAANREVIGPDPDVIHPGQRLLPPPPSERTTR